MKSIISARVADACRWSSSTEKAPVPPTSRGSTSSSRPAAITAAPIATTWTAEDGDPQAGYDTGGQLSTPAFKALMTKAMRQTGANHITITGGEPLLRKDALELIEHAGELATSVTLITNGSHVTEDVARRLATAGVSSVQPTLLAPERDEHDRLKGAVCFDDTVRAAVNLAEVEVPVQVCFVAMHENADRFAEVMELCFALGVRGILVQPHVADRRGECQDAVRLPHRRHDGRKSPS